MENKPCKNCGTSITPHQAIAHDGCCTESCLEVWTAVNVVNQRPAMRVIKTVAALLLLAGSAQARDYHAEAVRLKRLAHPKAKVETIEKTLKVVDWSLKKHFPHHEYSRVDVLAIILGESAFYEREVCGRTRDSGLFQVQKAYFRPGLNPYDVRVNTEYGFRVLKAKHRRFGYKNGVIAYNGLIRDKRTGKVKGNYWRWFCHNRKRVVLALGVTHRNVRYPAPVVLPVKVACIYPAKPTVAQISEARYLEEMSPS